MKKWIYLSLTVCAVLFVVWSCNNDDDTTAPDASTNTAPTLDAKTLNAAENVLGGQKIGDITAQDEDGDPLEFTLSGDTPFLLSKTGELTLAEDEQLDYEDITEYELNISVSDGTASDSETFTLKVMDIDEAPEFELEFFQFGTEEGKDNTEPIGTVEAMDPEGATLEYSITENDQDLFTIDKATGAIRVAEGKTLNFEAFEGEEAVYTITVEATDQENQSSIVVSITLADGDEFPVFGETEYTFKVEETKLEIGEVSATDPENDPLTYSIAVNASELFVINAETGKITLAQGKTLDFEAFGEDEKAEYNITVQATDPGDNITQVAVTIEITDVEEAPTVTTEGFEVVENSTEVGKVLATDPQEDAITFALVANGDADGLFVISDDGTVQVTEGNTLDYEAEVQAFEITVVVEDNFGNSTEATIPIAVTNVDEAPELTSSTTITVDEDVPHPQLFALLMATDPEGEDVTFELTDDADGVFQMTAEGAIYLANGQQLDYEQLPNLYEITVAISDGTNEVVYEIEIQVQDVLDQLPNDPSTSFIMTWETTQADEVIAIGIYATDGSSYDFYVEST
ncbi:MAG: cadherin domain-containing protein [Bacteroidota bacterium]